MKNVIISIFLVFSLSNLFSQDYIPLVKEGKYWIYSNRDGEACEGRDLISHEIIYFKGDTIINNIKYKKLVSSKVPFNKLPYKITSREDICYMREDTIMRKVYMIQFKFLGRLEFPMCSNGAEVCVWDFGLKPRDTMPICMQQFLIYPLNHEAYNHYVLDSISDFIDSLGFSRRLFHTIGINPCTCGGLINPFAEFQYLEGFGNLFGPIFTCNDFREIHRYCEGTESHCNIVVINSVNNIDQKSTVFIEPNPASNYIKINTDIELEKTDVINGSGQLMITSTSKTIDVESLQSGIYYVRCLSKDKSYYHSKFIKI